MAVGEARRQVTAAKGGNVLSQVSWTDGVAQDVYYGLDHSFLYANNINCDDELHGIKLSNRVDYTSDYSKCQLVSLGEHGVMALPVDTNTAYSEVLLKRFQYNGYYADTKWEELNASSGTTYTYTYDVVPGVVFQDRFWFGFNTSGGTSQNPQKGYMSSVFFKGTSPVQGDEQEIYLPYDHNDYTDESIEDSQDAIAKGEYMRGNITAILNYNNTRLVVAAGQDIWVYYPELDGGAEYDHKLGTQGWKKVLSYEAGVTIVALTCTFEYLKVRAVDEGWNTKVYYYQGNNNLRSTFVYNLVDLTGVRVLHVYSINGIDYYTSSINGTDGLIDFNKMVGATPVKLFTQRAGLTMYDVNYKAPYFVGPTSISGDYNNGNIYVADAYGVFIFKYNPQGIDKGYMKRYLSDNKQVYGLCINKGFLYVSTEDGCYAMRLYDTGVDGYQESGVLISREMEGREGGVVTKMLDEIRMNFELNHLTNDNGTIDVYIAPNNRWTRANLNDYKDKGIVARKTSLPITGDTGDFYRVTGESAYYTWDDDSDEWIKIGKTLFGRYHVMHIDQESANTRTEKSNLLNDLYGGASSFKFDWQTINYAIVIRRGEEEQATPIVRQLTVKYHCKDKINNVYDIN